MHTPEYTVPIKPVQRHCEQGSTDLNKASSLGLRNELS